MTWNLQDTVVDYSLGGPSEPCSESLVRTAHRSMILNVVLITQLPPLLFFRSIGVGTH